MTLGSRALMVPGVVAIFWPCLTVEVAGVALILGLLALNWWGSKADTSPRAADPA